MILVSPVLTRIFEPSTFGVYQTALALAVVLLPIATLRFDYTLVTTRSRALFEGRLRLARWTALATSVIALVLTWAGCAVAHVPDPGAFAALAALMLFVYSFMAIDNAALLRTDAHLKLATRNALSGCLAAGLQVLFGLLGWGALGLALGLALGRLVAVAATWQRRSWVDDDMSTEDASSSVSRTASLVVSGIIGNATSQCLLVVVVVAFGAAEAGQLGVAQRLAGAPILLLGQGLTQVFVATAAPYVRARRPGLIRGLWSRIRAVLLVSCAMAIGMAAFGPWMATLLLGADWEQAGTILRVLAVPISLQLLAIPLGTVMGLMEREWALLGVQLFRLGAIVCATGVAALMWSDFEVAIAVGSAAWTLSYVFMAVMFFRMENSRSIHLETASVRDGEPVVS
jgi:O-antigen/teichoic acid export membrane protein